MQDTRRYYSLDALRGVMMMLGIVIHGSMWYLSEPLGGIPMPSDRSTSYFFDLLAHFIHSFRMPLFFILAGFFTSLLVEKRGVKGTYINRGQRILAPLLGSALTVWPLSLLFMGAFLVSARFHTHQLIPSSEQLEIMQQEIVAAGLPNEPTVLHLWFLIYLLYFYLTIPLCIALVRWLRPWQTRIDAWLAHPGAIVVLGAYTALTLWPFKAGMVYEGFGFITPHVPSMIYYGSFFVLGYVLHSHRSILHTFRTHFAFFGLLSVILFPTALYLSGLDLAAAGLARWLHGAAVLVHGSCTWALIYFLMGLFLRYLDTESPWVLYTSQSSYWVYLLHMPVISFAAWWMLPYDLHAFVKFPLIVLFTVLVCFVSYHYLVQRTWISVFLNGRRFDLRWPWLERRQAER